VDKEVASVEAVAVAEADSVAVVVVAVEVLAAVTVSIAYFSINRFNHTKYYLLFEITLYTDIPIRFRARTP